MTPEPRPIPQADLQRSGRVSLWLGNAATEDELYQYLDETFPGDFGFAIHEPAGPECFVADRPLPIAELLDGFSAWRDFANDAVRAAAALRWDRATTAVVFYALEYRPDLLGPRASGVLTYIGSFRFGKGG